MNVVEVYLKVNQWTKKKVVELSSVLRVKRLSNSNMKEKLENRDLQEISECM